MQINVTVTDANNIVCTVVPPQVQTITIDRGVAGNGIVSIVPVTISTFQYLRITYTNGTVSDVGPLTSTAYTATSPITIVGNTISLATVPIASGGTGATTAATAIQNLLPSYTGNGSKRLGLNSGATALEWVTDGGGTVTSVDVSGGTTGLTTSGGPITSSGTITLAGTLAIANGGSGQTTAQLAMNAFAGAVTSGSYLRGNGTNVVMATIQVADVPTLNQNTTGTAANITATSNSTLTTLSVLSLPGSQVSGNISGNAANVTGTVAIANGGTGATTAATARTNLGATTVGGNLFTLTNPSAITFPQFNADNTVSALTASAFRTAIGAGTGGGSVTSVSGTGMVSGLTLSGTVTTSGSLTLGGTLDLSAYNSAGAFTTLSASSTVTLSGGTANGVAYLNGSKVLTTGSVLTFDGATFTSGAHTLSTGNLNFSSTAQRITGDFSNATLANRLYVQSNTTNGSTSFGVIPNGTGASSAYNVFANSDPTNTSFAQLRAGTDTSDVRLSSGISGTGTYLPITFFTGGSERVRIDTSGNVGIGTSSPSGRLDVVSSGIPYTNIYTTAASGIAAGLTILASTTSGEEFLAYRNTLRFGNATGVNAAGFSEKMRIDSSGNFGLGVTPSAWDFGGNLVLPGAGTYVASKNINLTFAANLAYTGGAEKYVASNPATKYYQGSGTHAWYTAPSGTAGNAITFTQAMTLDASGNLLVGTTSQAAGLGYSASAIVGSYGPVFKSTGGTAGYEAGSFWNIATTGDNIFCYFRTEAAGNSRGSISYNRGAGLVAYNVTSDYRSKDISGPVTDSGAVIDSVPVYIGKMKGATQERPMFIAHEVPAYAHTGEKDAVDADGNPVYQQMDTSALVPVLWAEIQSLRKRLTALEGKA